MIMLRLIPILLLLLSPSGLAQPNSQKGPTVRLLAERVPPELGQVFLKTEMAASDAFDLPVNNLSNPISAPGRAFTVDSESKGVSLAKVILPDAGKAFIVLLVPDLKSGYKSVVVPANDRSFKPGDVYFYNHCNRTILGYVGTAKFILAPGKGESLRPKGAKPEGYYDVGFGVREKEGDRALSQTRWPVDERSRSYVFFFVDPKTKRLNFRAVDEFVPPGD